VTKRPSKLITIHRDRKRYNGYSAWYNRTFARPAKRLGFEGVPEYKAHLLATGKRIPQYDAGKGRK
jgi:hypothetical protein